MSINHESLGKIAVLDIIAVTLL